MKVDIKLWDNDSCNYCPLLIEKVIRGKKKKMCNFFDKEVDSDSRGRIGRLAQCLDINKD